MIFNLIKRGILKLIDDVPAIQNCQSTGLDGELLTDIERLQEYGLATHPLEGSQTVLLACNGNVDNTIIIMVDDRRYRVHLEKGEVALYTHEGDKVHLKKDRKIEVVGGAEVKFITPVVKITGDLQVEGNITAEGDIRDKIETNTRTMSSMRAIYNTHTHTETGSTTNAPTQLMN